MATTAMVAPAWVTGEQTHRVDPRAESAQLFAMAGASYRIDARGAVVTRDGVARPLPASAFEGIAARAVEDAGGAITVTLELMHADPALSVPVLVARDLYDVAGDWRAWAKRTGLPMLMVEGDGSVEVLDATPRAAAERAGPVARSGAGLGVVVRFRGREVVAA